MKSKTLYLSHGGGPMPLLGDPAHQEMVACLEKVASSIPKPRAIIVVSAHWEESVPTITAGTAPSLIYDYYGFPEESYQIQYPCPGEPVLAEKIHRLLSNSGMHSKLDMGRGFDHGLFVPLKIMYPEANIPSVRLSLVNTLDPSFHMEMGRALQTLLHQEQVLLIGSGFSFHNMRAFYAAESDQSQEMNHAFETWLLNTCSRSDCSEQERMQMLTQWAEAPGARFCHPREEHLLPLHVCYGAVEAPCSHSYELRIMHKKSSIYLW